MIMQKLPKHFVIYLSSGFYAAIASTIVEILQAVNTVNESTIFSYEFVSDRSAAVSRSDISFQAKKRPSKKADVFILLAGSGAEVLPQPHILNKEAERAAPFIRRAYSQGATIAGTCGAAYLLAATGLLDGKRATISWWLKNLVQQKFPAVKWEPSRIMVRQGNIYTSGGGFAGLELITALLNDLGFSKELRLVRKLLVLPPIRHFQSPYELPEMSFSGGFEKELNKLSKEHMEDLSLSFLSRQLSMSSRTLSRKFQDELDTSPGKWIQERRIAMAKDLLGSSKLPISEICYRIGYGDLASFSRLFSKIAGMTPGEFRKEIG
jgi:transcriptional regulator GlxA family with amidase domain